MLFTAGAIYVTKIGIQIVKLSDNVYHSVGAVEEFLGEEGPG